MLYRLIFTFLLFFFHCNGDSTILKHNYNSQIDLLTSDKIQTISLLDSLTTLNANSFNFYFNQSTLNISNFYVKNMLENSIKFGNSATGILFIGDFSIPQVRNQFIQHVKVISKRPDTALFFVPSSSLPIYSYLNDSIRCVALVNSHYLEEYVNTILIDSRIATIKPEDIPSLWRLVDESLEYIDIDYDEFLTCFNNKILLHDLNLKTQSQLLRQFNKNFFYNIN